MNSLIPQPGQLWQALRRVYDKSMQDYFVQERQIILILETKENNPHPVFSPTYDIKALVGSKIIEVKNQSYTWWEERFMRLYPEHWRNSEAYKRREKLRNEIWPDQQQNKKVNGTPQDSLKT